MGSEGADAAASMPRNVLLFSIMCLLSPFAYPMAPVSFAGVASDDCRHSRRSPQRKSLVMTRLSLRLALLVPWRVTCRLAGSNSLKRHPSDSLYGRRSGVLLAPWHFVGGQLSRPLRE